MNTRIRLISQKVLLLGFTLIVGWFNLPGIINARAPSGATDDISMEGSFLYSKPTEILNNAGAELAYQSEFNIMAERVLFKGVKMWQGQNHDLLMELQTQYQDVDLLNTRIIFVIRNREGSPWIVADGFLFHPAL